MEALIYIIGYIIGIIVGLILSIVIHESGHLICGILTGYRFTSFRLMNWLWTKDENGKIKLTSGSEIKGVGGQCLMEPPDNEADFRFLLYNSGGGLFNIITGTMFFVLCFLIDNDLLKCGLYGAGISAVLLGITNLIPMTIGGIPNDGKNIRETLKSADAKHGLYVMLKVNAEMSKGKHLSDFDDDTFIVDENVDVNNYLVANVISLHASQLEERGLYEQSYQTYLRLDPFNLPPFYSYQKILAVMFQELVFFGDEIHIQRARHRIDAKSGDKRFQIMLKMKHPAFLPFYAAKQAFLDDNIAHAVELIKQTRSLVPTLQNPGQEYSVNLMLDKIEEKIKSNG